VLIANLVKTEITLVAIIVVQVVARIVREIMMKFFIYPINLGIKLMKL
jgi:hypothetical protein